MGSGFGLDSIGSLKNNSRRYKRKSAFAGRGETPAKSKEPFTKAVKMSKTQLQALGEAQRKREMRRFIKGWVATLLLIGLVLLVFYFIGSNA